MGRAFAKGHLQALPRCFHIISKDTGFDPLIKHLKGQGISCQRSAAVTDMPMIKVANAESVPDRLDALLDNLIKRKAAKPRTVETLRNTIKTWFANKLSDHEIQVLLDQLAQRGVIRVSEGKVIYDLPP